MNFDRLAGPIYGYPSIKQNNGIPSFQKLGSSVQKIYDELPLTKSNPIPKEIIAVSEISVVDKNAEKTMLADISAAAIDVTSEIFVGSHPTYLATGEKAVCNLKTEKNISAVNTGKNISK
mmetsp:Transcript_53318/g.59591  ORF Transcript_53318/g.59591 Transcript_53318/m.59591 type:complete len:120 (+) Transcript_53318:606-965(+)